MVFMNKWANVVMDDGCMSSSIWLKPFLLLSATCDEILLQIIEIWLKNHLLSDSNCNTVHLKTPKIWQGMTKNVGSTFNVGDTTPHFTISTEKDN